MSQHSIIAKEEDIDIQMKHEKFCYLCGNWFAPLYYMDIYNKRGIIDVRSKRNEKVFRLCDHCLTRINDVKNARVRGSRRARGIYEGVDVPKPEPKTENQTLPRRIIR